MNLKIQQSPSRAVGRRSLLLTLWVQITDHLKISRHSSGPTETHIRSDFLSKLNLKQQQLPASHLCEADRQQQNKNKMVFLNWMNITMQHS